MFGATPGSWLVRGYVDAVERFREQAALGADSAREVYPPLFEALNWTHSLWDTWFRLVEQQDRHLDGLRHVRDRCHHQLASAIYPDAAAPGGGAGTRSVIFHPRILVVATTVRARRITPSSSNNGRSSRRLRLWRDTSARSPPNRSSKQTRGTAPRGARAFCRSERISACGVSKPGSRYRRRCARCGTSTRAMTRGLRIRTAARPRTRRRKAEASRPRKPCRCAVNGTQCAGGRRPARRRRTGARPCRGSRGLVRAGGT